MNLDGKKQGFELNAFCIKSVACQSSQGQAKKRFACDDKFINLAKKFINFSFLVKKNL